MNYINKEKNDEYFTPEIAVIPILKYLDLNKIYWECTDFGDSNITKVLKKNGFKVVHTNKDEIDFLNDKPNFTFDVIITNPPYSLKDEFLTKCYKYNKPFALLLPITALGGINRNQLYKKYGLELIVFNKRINFINGKNNVSFNSSWFCHDLCDHLLNFECL